MKFQNPFVDCLCACAVTPEFIEKCADAGVAAINKCICTDESMYQAIKEICNYREFIEKHSDIAMLVRRPEDIEEAYRQHKVGIMMGFQGTLPLEYDVRLADIYADAGVTIIQLTYNYRNLVGSGNMENNLVGLSEFGYEVIERLNKAGVLVDLSHACEQTQLEALKASKKPLMISHAPTAAPCTTPPATSATRCWRPCGRTTASSAAAASPPLSSRAWWPTPWMR